MQQADVTAKWGEWVSGMGDWHLFGGLTYDQRRRTTVPGADVAKRHVFRWLRDGPQLIGRPIEAAVIALEYQKNGWPHFHPLLRLPGGLQRNDVRELGHAWFRNHGYAKLEAPRSRQDVCEYASKYLAKDLGRGDIIFWPRRGSLSVHQPGLR